MRGMTREEMDRIINEHFGYEAQDHKKAVRRREIPDGVPRS